MWGTIFLRSLRFSIYVFEIWKQNFKSCFSNFVNLAVMIEKLGFLIILRPQIILLEHLKSLIIKRKKFIYWGWGPIFFCIIGNARMGSQKIYTTTMPSMYTMTTTNTTNTNSNSMLADNLILLPPLLLLCTYTSTSRLVVVVVVVVLLLTTTYTTTLLLWLTTYD